MPSPCIDLTIHSQNQKLKTISLPEGEYFIGSAELIHLDYPTVSRRHGKLSITFATDICVTYTDLQSKNGSYSDSSTKFRIKLPAQQSVEWKRGDYLYIGPFSLLWESPQEKKIKYENLDLEFVSKLHAPTYENLLNQGLSNPLENFSIILSKETTEPATIPKILTRIYGEYHQNGPLEAEIANPNLREILINEYNQIFIDTGRGLSKAEKSFFSEKTYIAWVTRTANHCGRRIDLQNPICEATLPNGNRFHAVLNPISGKSAAVSIRKFGAAPIDEQTAIQTQWMTHDQLEILKTAIMSQKNIVISGGTSTGKTSLLNFLCQYIRPNERVITIEDTIELNLPIQNLVQLQARKANADGAGEISLQKLIQCSLRMRPDRIIVGECRGAEVFEMLQALNTGHPGSLTTVHANSCTQALSRLELLALMGSENLSLSAIQKWLKDSIDLIVHLERDLDGRRYVSAIWNLSTDTLLDTQNQIKSTQSNYTADTLH